MKEKREREIRRNEKMGTYDMWKWRKVRGSFFHFWIKSENENL